MKEIKFTVAVRGEERIKTFDRFVESDHSNRIVVLNKGFDALVWKQRFMELCCSGVSPADAFAQLSDMEVEHV